jgi:hypothetical protein
MIKIKLCWSCGHWINVINQEKYPHIEYLIDKMRKGEVSILDNFILCDDCYYKRKVINSL